ncbi:hypothetical protein IGJ18_001611 [Enterococcus sp. AZ078]
MTVAIQSESEVVRMNVLPKSNERRCLLPLAEIIALIVAVAPCGKALFEFLTAVVKLFQAMNDAKNSKKK